MGSIKGTQINIQLAITDDLSKANSDMVAANQKLNAAIAGVETAFKAMRAETTNATRARDNAQKVMSNATKAATDLGVPASSVKGFGEVDKMWSTLDSTIDKANEIG